MPYQSRWSISPPVTSLPSFIFTSPTASLPDVPIFIDCKHPETHFLTLRTFRKWSKRFAAGLIAAGLEPGDRVLLFSGNRLFFPVVMMGVIMAGGIFSAANPSFTPRELAHQLKNAEVRFLLAADAAIANATVAAKLASMRSDQVFTFNDAPFDGLGDDVKGYRHWKCLIAPADVGKQFTWEECETREQADRTVMLLYSSGTTGLSKGVELSSFSLVATACQVIHMQDCDSKLSLHRGPLRSLCFLPMFHGLGLVWFACVAPKRGMRVYLMEKFDLLLMMEYIQRFQISELLMVPPVVVAMAKNPLIRAGKYNLSTVLKVLCGAAPLGREISEQFEQLWPNGGIKINQGWGASEVPCLGLGWHDRKVSDSTVTSVGELMANCEGKIMEDDGVHEVLQGARGEFWCRGPNTMKRYWRNVEATKETVTEDGWVKTGDIAFVDNDENFFIVDRKKELIKVKGQQVAPADLEALLLEHPGVADAAVIGVRITPEEERPRAYIVAKKGTPVTENEILEFIAERVAKVKRITGGVVFVAEIPKNASGKILRRMLRDRAAEEIKANFGKASVL